MKHWWVVIRAFPLEDIHVLVSVLAYNMIGKRVCLAIGARVFTESGSH